MRGALVLVLSAALAAPGLAGPGLPAGWSAAGSRPQEYEFGADAAAGAAGQAFYIKALPDVAGKGFGTMMKCVDANDYRNHNLRLSARLKSVNARTVQLWMRVDGSNKKMLSLYNMDDRPIRRTRDWADYDVVMNVPSQGARVCYGFILSGGAGEAWAEGLSLDTVSDNVPTSLELARLRRNLVGWSDWASPPPGYNPPIPVPPTTVSRDPNVTVHQ